MAKKSKNKPKQPKKTVRYVQYVGGKRVTVDATNLEEAFKKFNLLRIKK